MSNRTTWLKRAVLLAVCQLWLIVSPSPTSACDDAVTVTIDGDIATVADCSVTYFHASGVPAGGQYQWEVSGGEILAGENGELMCFKAGQTPGPAWVKVTYTYENEDANDKDEFNIVVVELIAVEPNGAVIEIGQSMTFQAVTNPAEYKYLVTWQISSSLEWVGTNPEQGTITVRGKAADEQAYVRARCGCGEPKTANVRVRPHVGVGLSGLPSTVAACAELELKAVGTPSGGTYEWDWSGGDLDDQGDGNAVFTVQEEPGEGYVTVTYRVQDIECNDTREFEIVDANMAGVEPNCKIIAIGTTTTFTARTDPSGYESGVVWRVEDANSLEICGSPSGASLTVRGVQSGENLGVVAEAGCDSEATASVTVIRVKDLQVDTFFHKATEVPPDSNNYVVCTDEGADPNQWFGRTWIIAFFDPDVWLDDSNLVALVHWTGAEQDEENPDQASIPLNAIGHRTVTVTCGTSHATVDLWFIKMNSMTVQDAGGSGLSRTVPDDANDLYIPEGAGGATAINLGASFEPSSAGQYVRWEVEGDGAEPNSGTFAGGSPAVTLRPPPEGDRTYTVRVGLDDGQGGFVQGGCPVLELKVCVVKIQSMTVRDKMNAAVSRTNPPDANDLWVQMLADANDAWIEVSAVILPDDAKGMVRWSVQGASATPETGNFAAGPSSIWLTPEGGNSLFTATVWLDLNGDGTLQSGESTFSTAVHVLRVKLKAVSLYGDGQNQLRKTGAQNYMFSRSGFASDGDRSITNPVWLDNNCNGDANEPGDVMDPICFTKSTMVQSTAAFPVFPPLSVPIPATVRARIGSQPILEKQVVLQGSELLVTEPNFCRSDDGVLKAVGCIDWELKVQGGSYQPAGTSWHQLFVTWSAPSGSPATANRVEWAVGPGLKTTEEAVADYVHSQLGDHDPPYEPDEEPNLGSGWGLLDLGTVYYGECDEQAELMQLAMRIVGIGASGALVRASTDAGAGNCLDQESRPAPGGGGYTQWLILDFEPSGSGHWANAFEGCCVTAGHYYAVWPKKKATDDYDLLKQLRGRQFWVKTQGNIRPGDDDWAVEVWFEEVPKP